MNQKPTIEFADISKSFAKAKVLDNVNLTLKGGRIYHLSGENGAGKTTLLRILAGLLPADTGSVNIGFRPESLNRIRTQLLLNLMYLHQTPYMFAGSVQRNLSIVSDFSKDKKTNGNNINDKYTKSERIDQALEWAKLSKYKFAHAKTLSGGQQQRIALARAWLKRPPFLLLDEPIANMDTSSAHRTVLLLKELRDSGIGMIISSHNMQIFNEHIDQHLILKDGKLSEMSDMEYGGNVVSINDNATSKSIHG